MVSFGIDKISAGPGSGYAGYNLNQMDREENEEAVGIWDPEGGRRSAREEEEYMRRRRAATEVPFQFIAGQHQTTGYDEMQALGQQNIQNLLGMQATPIDAAQIATDPQAQFRQSQMDALAQLQARAGGTAPPSVAEQAAIQQGQMASNRAMALARTQQGMSPGAALRAAREAQATGGIAAEQQRGMIATQEQQLAQQQAAQLSGQVRAGDIGMATGQAELEQQAALANQQNEMKYNQMREDLIQKYMQAGMDFMIASQKAATEIDAMRTQELGAIRTNLAQLQAAQMGADVTRESAMMSAIGTGISSAGNIISEGISTSDRRAKHNITDGTANIDEFLDVLGRGVKPDVAMKRRYIKTLERK